MWTLSRIAIYPIKSFDPIFVHHAEVLSEGALLWDRQYALFDKTDHVVNGKKYPKVHQVRTIFDLSKQTVSISTPRLSNESTQFHLTENRVGIETWFSNYFDQPITLKENKTTGFPDDMAALGPTIISTQTYEELSRWFPDISIEELRLRFRANLEFDGDFPFCEDRLYSETKDPVLFQIGSVIFEGSNPCKRCVVPSRSPLTGETNSAFMKTFIQKRKETFPEWAPISLFTNMYRLTVNTRLSNQSDSNAIHVKIGDRVNILA